MPAQPIPYAAPFPEAKPLIEIPGPAGDVWNQLDLYVSVPAKVKDLVEQALETPTEESIQAALDALPTPDEPGFSLFDSNAPTRFLAAPVPVVFDTPNQHQQSQR